MNDNLYRKLIELYSNKNYKEIVCLYSYVVVLDKNGGNLNIYRFISKDKIIFSLSAKVWNKEDLFTFKTIKSEIEFCNLENINYSTIKKRLIYDIYEKIIKNEIMMV